MVYTLIAIHHLIPTQSTDPLTPTHPIPSLTPLPSPLPYYYDHYQVGDVLYDVGDVAEEMTFDPLLSPPYYRPLSPPSPIIMLPIRWVMCCMTWAMSLKR